MRIKQSVHNRRSPHGERGLKYITASQSHQVELSLPTRGAWIEILSSVRISLLHQVAPHTGSDLIPSVCDTKLFENLGNSLFAVFLEIPFISSSEYFQLCIRRPCIGALLRIAFFCTLCVVDVFRHTLSFFTDKDSTPVVSDTGKLYF